MKTLTSFLVAVAALGGLFAGQARAFADPKVDILVKPGGLIKDQILTKDAKSKIDVQDNSKINQMRGGLVIKSFTAARDLSAKTINFNAKVVFDTIFTKAKPITFNFKIQRKSSKLAAWTTLAEGTNRIAQPNTPVAVLRTINGINETVRLRIAVWSDKDKMVTKEFSLPALPPPVFVVTYSTDGFVPIAHYTEKPNPNHLIGEAATALGNKVRPLGFQTKMKIDKNEVPFFESNEIWLWAQALTAQTREFGTMAEAEAFKSRLFSLMRNIDGRGPRLKVSIDQKS